jgi:hypothetical protein
VFDLRGTKIDLRKSDGSVDEEKSRAFQEMCFARGIYWSNNGVQHIDAPFLFASDKSITYEQEDILFFNKHKNKQIDIIPHTIWEVVDVSKVVTSPRKTITIGDKTFYEDDLINRCEGLQEVK